MIKQNENILTLLSWFQWGKIKIKYGFGYEVSNETWIFLSWGNFMSFYFHWS